MPPSRSQQARMQAVPEEQAQNVTWAVPTLALLSPGQAGKRQASTDAASVSEVFRSLSEESGGTNVSLARLNARLEMLFEVEGVSKKVFKDEVKNKGICLADCKEYGSQQKLRALLQRDKSKIVFKKDAKRYPFVKDCLIFLTAPAGSSGGSTKSRSKAGGGCVAPGMDSLITAFSKVAVIC